MVEKQVILNLLDEIAPLKLAEPWDNCGLLVDARDKFSNIMVCLDVTKTVIEEAADKKCDLIVSHHPAIFDGLKQLSHDDIPFLAVQKGISLYAAHTNMDKAPDGLNQQLAEDIGLTDISGFGFESIAEYTKIVTFCPKSDEQAIREALFESGAGCIGNYSECAFKSEGIGSFKPLDGANPAIGNIGEVEYVPEIRIETICKKSDMSAVIDAIKKAHSYEEPVIDAYDLSYPSVKTAFGRIGKLKEPMGAEAFGRYLADKLNAGTINVAGDKNIVIKTVAVSCGAGADLMAQAKSAGADAFVTGEMKHHQYLESQKLGIVAYEAGHFHTEKQFVKLMQSRLQAALNRVKSNVLVFSSESERCPYFEINQN